MCVCTCVCVQTLPFQFLHHWENLILVMMLALMIGYIKLGIGQESLTHLYKSKPDTGRL